jgi:hypothetical protein
MTRFARCNVFGWDCPVFAVVILIDKINATVFPPFFGYSSHNQIPLTVLDLSGSVFRNYGEMTF